MYWRYNYDLYNDTGRVNCHVDRRLKRTRPSLLEATDQGHQEIMKLLIHKEAKIDSVDQLDCTHMGNQGLYN